MRNKQNMKEVLIFHHSDLDGMCVKIVGIKYAQLIGAPYRTFKCDYSNVNKIVTETLRDTPLDNIQEIIIGDISVDVDTAELLDKISFKNIPVRLRDHHATAEWMCHMYPWAKVSEKDEDGISRCGGWLLSMDKDMIAVRRKLENFITAVDDWDTWKWTWNHNDEAKQLNDLFQMLGEEEFTKYILGKEDFDSLFNDFALTAINLHTAQVDRMVRRCLHSMYEMDLPVGNRRMRNHHVYKAGVIFCNSDISNVCNGVLEERDDIDILIVVNLPSGISLRTRKELETPLGEVAKMLTGSGGGHPSSAGANIDSRQMVKLIYKAFEVLSRKVLKPLNVRKTK